MGNDRFVVNPFEEFLLSPSDKKSLKDFGDNFINANVETYEAFIAENRVSVNPTAWKLVKSKGETRVYRERRPVQKATYPKSLMTGVTWGTVDDVMFGALNPTLESMRIKASYVDDMSGGAVLASLEMPSVHEPFKSMTVKWMELDLPFAKTPLVKNRDYVFLESTNTASLSTGERVGVMVFHSVSFPQAKALPGRIRANMSTCCIFRQIGPDTVEVYGSGVTDPGGDRIQKLVMPTIATGYLSTLKYAHCSNMKKLVWLLEQRYALAKDVGLRARPGVCIMCTSSAMATLRVGDYSKSQRDTCKLCNGYLCRACRSPCPLTFVGADLQLQQRNVTFCGLCRLRVRKMSPIDVAKEHAVLYGRQAASLIDTELTTRTASSSDVMLKRARNLDR
ncbi:unnamed protein product [Hyaloperonospora brassicae]|uniref:FYVE-type domain-containing protein n=1 Tax=Hyaloperonospora brassicae TaxID=162125 RepID=A0AAV0TTH6_HYABA|nr:unnamed protein product [Hyaloperonospora brassicae]